MQMSSKHPAPNTSADLCRFVSYPVGLGSSFSLPNEVQLSRSTIDICFSPIFLW